MVQFPYFYMLVQNTSINKTLLQIVWTKMGRPNKVVGTASTTKAWKHMYSISLRNYIKPLSSSSVAHLHGSFTNRFQKQH